MKTALKAKSLWGCFFVTMDGGVYILFVSARASGLNVLFVANPSGRKYNLCYALAAL